MAISANNNIETRAGLGSDNFGGGYVSGSSGTDYSQQTTAQVAIDNSTITTSITTSVITFVTGYTPSSADVGNIVQMLTGTNVTAGFYQITAINVGSKTWTVDRNVVTSGTTTNATGNMGGCLSTLDKAVSAASVSGNVIFAKGAFAPTAGTLTLATGVTLFGYSTTRGDGGRATVNASGMTTSVNTFTIGTGAKVFNVAVTGSRAISFSGGSSSLCWNCTSTSSLSHGFSGCFAAYCTSTSSGGAGFNAFLGASYCFATGNTTSGFLIASAGYAIRSVAYNNTVNGFAGVLNTYMLDSCVSHSNLAAGFVMSTNAPAVWSNLVAWGSGTYGFVFNTTGIIGHGINKSCFAGSNTSGPVMGSSTFDDTITNLSAQPFVDPTSTFDYTPNTTAGGGALLRAAGFNSILGLAVPGSQDAGAIQSPIGPTYFSY